MKKSKKPILLSLFLLPVALCCTASSNAQSPVTFDFNGAFVAAGGVTSDTGVGTTPAALDALLGEDFSVSYTIDPGAPNELTENGVAAVFPNLGIFRPDDVSAVFGSTTLTSVGGTITVNNNRLRLGAPEDDFSIRVSSFAGTLPSSFDAFDQVSFNLILRDSTGSVFSSADLPSTQLDPADFDVAFAGLLFQNDAGDAGGTLVADLNAAVGAPALTGAARADALSLFAPVAVPEPSGLLPLALAACGLCTRRRKRAQGK